MQYIQWLFSIPKDNYKLHAAHAFSFGGGVTNHTSFVYGCMPLQYLYKQRKGTAGPKLRDN